MTMTETFAAMLGALLAAFVIGWFGATFRGMSVPGTRIPFDALFGVIGVSISRVSTNKASGLFALGVGLAGLTYYVASVTAVGWSAPKTGRGKEVVDDLWTKATIPTSIVEYETSVAHLGRVPKPPSVEEFEALIDSLRPDVSYPAWENQVEGAREAHRHALARWEASLQKEP